VDSGWGKWGKKWWCPVVVVVHTKRTDGRMETVEAGMMKWGKLGQHSAACTDLGSVTFAICIYYKQRLEIVMDARLFDWGCAYKSKKASNISNSKVRMLLLLPHGVKNVAKKRGVNNNNNNTNNVDGE
jgi:hypothetical protein